MPTDERVTTEKVDELTAMRRITNALDSLDPDAQARVVAYLNSRYGPELRIKAPQPKEEEE